LPKKYWRAGNKGHCKKTVIAPKGYRGMDRFDGIMGICFRNSFLVLKSIVEKQEDIDGKRLLLLKKEFGTKTKAEAFENCFPTHLSFGPNGHYLKEILGLRI